MKVKKISSKYSSKQTFSQRYQGKELNSAKIFIYGFVIGMTLLFVPVYFLMQQIFELKDEILYYKVMINNADERTMQDFVTFLNSPLSRKYTLENQPVLLLTLIKDHKLREQILQQKITERKEQFDYSLIAKPTSRVLSFVSTEFRSPEVNQSVTNDFYFDCTYLNKEEEELFTEPVHLQFKTERLNIPFTADMKTFNPTGLNIISYSIENKNDQH